MDEQNCGLISSARWTDAATSVLVSRTLNNIGYSLTMVRLRQDIYKQLMEVLNQNEADTVIVSGSKAEGLSKHLESDFDFLKTSPKFICTTNRQNYIQEMCRTIFQIDAVDTSPGYARLFHDGPVHDDKIESIMYSTAGLSYLPSDKWRILSKQAINTENPIVQCLEEFSGPSCPVHLNFYKENVQISSDVVDGILCICPDIIRTWIDRQRGDFPSFVVIQDISNMEAHAVPVGYKESEWQFLEWRICFTKAEIRLVQSLNDCQTKLLILLRKIAKLCLKPICNEMSSYIMKNIVLWMSEQMPGNYFIEGNLCQALEMSLKMLQSCLIRKWLPSYMVAERNLLSGRVTLCERSELCREIDSLLREGPRVVQRWNLIKSALYRLYCSPDKYVYLSKLYVLFEMLAWSRAFEEYQLESDLKATINEALLSVYPELNNNLSEHLMRNILIVFMS